VSRQKMILQKVQMRKLLLAQMARILFGTLGWMFGRHMFVQLKLCPASEYAFRALILLGHVRSPPMLVHQRVVLELLLANVALQRRTVFVPFFDVYRIPMDHHQVVGLVDPIAHIASIFGMLGFHVNGSFFA
jgi:intracellular septation protein A